jgi:hypothetical protein
MLIIKYIRRFGGVTQVIESLPSKHGTLSSNSSTAKKKKKEKIKYMRYTKNKKGEMLYRVLQPRDNHC